MKVSESIIILILVLSQGFIGGLGLCLYKLGSTKDVYVGQCLSNNKTDYFNTAQVNQCTKSFEIYKNKEN